MDTRLCEMEVKGRQVDFLSGKEVVQKRDFFNKTKYLKETYSGLHPDSYKKSSITHLTRNKQTN